MSYKTKEKTKENELNYLFQVFINESQFSAGLRRETLRGYTNVFNLFLKIMPEVQSKEELTEHFVNLFFLRIRTRIRIIGKNREVSGVKNSTIKTQWAKLNVFFKWLKNKQYIEDNPFERIKKPKVDYEDPKALKTEEVNKIYSSLTLNYTNSLSFNRDRMIISLLLFCGLRRGELISLKIQDIDIDKKIITIRGETSKSGKTRYIPINPTLLLNIKDYLKERSRIEYKTSNLIISTKTYDPLTMEGLRHFVKAIIKKSGVRFHLHQFRHTFAKKMAENDVSMFKIQKLMGHKDIRMTARYQRSFTVEELRDGIDKLQMNC